MTKSDMRLAIQEAMRAAFPEAETRVARFYALQEYHLGWRDSSLQPASGDAGKLLRPQLALLACRAVGGRTEQALPLAAGIQLAHDFSLIHDDIEDNSETRRGRTTVWKLCGLAQGINAGDGMLIIAHLSLHRLVDQGIPADVSLRVLQRFDQTILTICEGQFLDLSYEGDLRITEDDYLAMIQRKTATLIASAAELGSIVGGAEKTSSLAFFRFGESLGMAFQIQDDILGIWGDPKITGKPRAADLYRRKVSLPIVHALRHADNSNSADLEQIYRQTQVSDVDVDRALEILDVAEARRYCEDIAAHYHQQALAALDQVQTGGNESAEAALNQIRTTADGLRGRKT
ncbi:MAG: polyprenyl synthetase family protein [Chloroflexales bacterium]|nr:polyprenyl synthetase family protein [Chloroflexales bacterium]